MRSHGFAKPIKHRAAVDTPNSATHRLCPPGRPEYVPPATYCQQDPPCMQKHRRRTNRRSSSHPCTEDDTRGHSAPSAHSCSTYPEAPAGVAKLVNMPLANSMCWHSAAPSLFWSHTRRVMSLLADTKRRPLPPSDRYAHETASCLWPVYWCRSLSARRSHTYTCGKCPCSEVNLDGVHIRQRKSHPQFTADAVETLARREDVVPIGRNVDSELSQQQQRREPRLVGTC